MVKVQRVGTRSCCYCSFRKPQVQYLYYRHLDVCSIGDNSTIATIFLSTESALILDKELQKNFNITRADLEQEKSESIQYDLNILKTKKIKVNKQIRELESFSTKKITDIKIPSVEELIEIQKESYIKEGGIYINEKKEATVKQRHNEQKVIVNGDISLYSITSKIASKTHLSCLDVKSILQVNNYLKNEIKNIDEEFLTDYLSDYITKEYFEYKEKIFTVEQEIELTKNFPFKLSKEKNKESLVIYKKDYEDYRLGFHINPYVFDSEDEKQLFDYLANVLNKNESIKDIYFTGYNSDSLHTDFYFDYYNPKNERIMRYFPDFLIETSNNRFIVVEVKGDNERIDYEDNKKRYKGSMKELSNEVFSKEIGFNEFQKINNNFEYHIIFNAKLQQKQREILEHIKKYYEKSNYTR